MATQLPDEMLSSLNETIKCRELQHQQTACLLTVSPGVEFISIAHEPDSLTFSVYRI